MIRQIALNVALRRGQSCSTQNTNAGEISQAGVLRASVAHEGSKVRSRAEEPFHSRVMTTMRAAAVFSELRIASQAMVEADELEEALQPPILRGMARRATHARLDVIGFIIVLTVMCRALSPHSAIRLDRAGAANYTTRFRLSAPSSRLTKWWRIPETYGQMGRKPQPNSRRL